MEFMSKFDILCYFYRMRLLIHNEHIMNISLTTELETFVKDQVASGHYKSASEVMREALRHYIRNSMENRLEKRLASSRQQYQSGDYVVADDAFFDRKVAGIKAKYKTQ